MLHAVEGVEFLAMTSNGILLTEFARPLKSAGLDALNISLDTLDPDQYSKITRCGSLKSALDGIETARQAGFDKIKINMVVSDETGSEDIAGMESFCRNRGLTLQKIRQ